MQTVVGSDVFFLVMGAVLVLAMHAGFAFLEAGTVRKKNQVNALMKILSDFSVSTVAYFFVGYAVAYGINFFDEPLPLRNLQPDSQRNPARGGGESRECGEEEPWLIPILPLPASSPAEPSCRSRAASVSASSSRSSCRRARGQAPTQARAMKSAAS